MDATASGESNVSESRPLVLVGRGSESRRRRRTLPRRSRAHSRWLGRGKSRLAVPVTATGWLTIREMAYVNRSLCVVGGVASVLLLAACGQQKLSARETEEVFKREIAPSAINVRCGDAEGSWDYICTYDYRFKGRLEHSSVGVRVDDNGITDRTAP